MQVEWYGQSAFALSTSEETVAIDPFGDMSGLAKARGMRFDYPPIEGLSADLLLITHEHIDHTATFDAVGRAKRDACHKTDLNIDQREDRR